jgi:hypothetical protein
VNISCMSIFKGDAHMYCIFDDVGQLQYGWDVDKDCGHFRERKNGVFNLIYWLVDP